MEYLLDTHAFLWFIAGSPEMSSKAKGIILNPENKKFISIASFWEIAIKLKLNKIQLDMSFKELKNQALVNGFRILPILFEETLRLTTLELHHRDPFDRILISQAFQNKFSIISKDPEFKKYTNKVIW
jgi:Uncharacterized protein conserved in bacteria